MGAYGVGAVLLSSYLWAVIAIDVGGGRNLFDRGADTITIARRGFRRLISFTLPCGDVQAVKVEVRDGLNPRRRLALRLRGRRDVPLTRIGEPIALAELERSGAELARYLNVPLEGV